MHIVNVSDLKPGDIVARPLWDEMGQVLLHAGVELQPNYIDTLHKKGFTQIYVHDPETPLRVEAEEDISPATRARALVLIREAYQALEGEVAGIRKRSSVEDFKRVFASDAIKTLLSVKGPIGRVRDIVGDLLDEVLTRSTLAGLSSIKCADSKLYEHSLDVCVVAIMIGRAVGMTNIRLFQLATGCLLHDIGKVFLDPEIPPERRLRQHPVLGFELLRNSPDPDILAPHVAYEHHERSDGSGVPRGVVSSNTVARNRSGPGPVPTLIGEVAAIANAYDNLMNGEGHPITPDEAIRRIAEGAGTCFNREIVNAFLQVVPVFPQGLEVLVRTEPYRNFTAIVTKVNADCLSRPVITLVSTPRGVPVEPLEINLAEDRDMQIKIRPV